MAKVKGMAATNYVGKLGPQIFYMRDGQNVVREKASQVSNPRTTGQMDQRVKLSNLVAIYRANKVWMESYAFTPRPQTWSVYNAFVSANLTQNDIFLTKTLVEAQASVAGQYIISKGNLPTIQTSFDNDTPGWAGPKFDQSVTPHGLSGTIAEVSQALLNANPSFRNGDQISFCANLQFDTAGTPYVQALYGEFLINTDNNSPFEDLDIAQYVTLAVGETSPLILTLDSLDLDNFHGAMATWVHSRRNSDGSMSVSTQRLVADNLIGDYTSLYKGESAQRRARRSYGETEEPFLVPGYGDVATNPTISINVVQPSAGTLTANGRTGVFSVPLGNLVTLNWQTAIGYELVSYKVNGQEIAGATFQPVDDSIVYQVSCEIEQTE